MRAAILGVVLATTACTSVVAGHGTTSVRAAGSSAPSGPSVSFPPGASVPAGPSASAGAGAADPSLPTLDSLRQTESQSWVKVADRPSQMTFHAPVRPHVVRGTQNGLTTRQYTDAFGGTPDGPGLSVDVIVLPSASLAAAQLKAYPDLIKAQFQVDMPSDFAITERHRGVYLGHATSDMRIGFTPLDFPDESTIWFIRIIQDGRNLVLAQTIVPSPKSDEADYVTVCRALHAKLVSGIAFT